MSKRKLDVYSTSCVSWNVAGNCFPDVKKVFLATAHSAILIMINCIIIHLSTKQKEINETETNQQHQDN